MGAGGELSVRKGPRAPLAKLHVAGGIQKPRLPEPLHIAGPGIHILAPLQHDAGQSVPGQIQGRKQARGPHPHHHRRQGGGPLFQGEPVGERLPGLDFARPEQNSALVRQRHIHCIDAAHVLLFPGVDGLPGDRKPLQRPRLYPQGVGGSLFQIVHSAVHRQGQIPNPKHRPPPLIRTASRAGCPSGPRRTWVPPGPSGRFSAPPGWGAAGGSAARRPRTRCSWTPPRSPSAWRYT